MGVAFVLNDLHRILHQFKVDDGKIVGQQYTFADEAVRSVESPIYQLARKSRFPGVATPSALGVRSAIGLYAGHRFPSTTGPTSTAWREESWRDIEVQLREMVALGRARGLRVFLVAFPFGEQLRPDYLARDRARDLSGGPAPKPLVGSASLTSTFSTNSTLPKTSIRTASISPSGAAKLPAAHRALHDRGGPGAGGGCASELAALGYRMLVRYCCQLDAITSR